MTLVWTKIYIKDEEKDKAHTTMYFEKSGYKVREKTE